MTDRQSSAQPPQPTQPVQDPAAAVTSEPIAQEPPKKSRTGLVVGIVIAAVVVIGLVIAGIVVANALGGEEQRVPYVSEEYGYSVEFPGEPTEDSQTQSIGGIEVTMVQAQWASGDRMFVSAAADMSQFLEGQEPDVVLENSIAGAAANTGATATDHEFIELDGERALTAQLDFGNGQSLLWLVAVRDGIQYQLGAPSDAADHDWFVESFSFSD